MPILALTIIFSVILNIILFLIAYRLQSDKLTDISYALTFVLLVWVALFNSEHVATYAEILAAIIIIWAVRIGSFLLMRVMTAGRDSRFDGVRENFIKFGRFWLGQGLTVWILLIPAILAISNGGRLNWLAYIGLVVWAMGVSLEATADIQKFQFSQIASNKNKWIESGVWKYSRHPNYFGEILTWIGVYLFALEGLGGYQKILGLISPAYIAVLLIFITGIPILEKSADKRWGSIKEYKAYKKRTSILVPLPNKK